MRRCTATARRNGTQSCLFRCEALAWSGICTLNYLVDQHDFITNWDDIEQIWYHTCHNEFHVDPQKHPVLLTEAPHNSKSKRQKMAEIMFEDSGHRTTVTPPYLPPAWVMESLRNFQLLCRVILRLRLSHHRKNIIGASVLASHKTLPQVLYI
ncbi:hypothetical protein ERO13_D11G017350v2 [Gossypium hirsutum]|uniref:Uncharacterized protein n=2 Tax=Gossypium TaxID=3633 RepID=A0A5D2SM02_GOSMU|nr:hypothetical protein ERO13_D11G017350v2 [Gossypium hirsutum]TYH41791.1 hypothetical protein ES332_D11G017900v1 [Gossypium tomentosum]TYI53622.1 hypothetical protein E1A91_D11G018000v1 [Gossypium mustelinum]